jgi:adenylylsulfate kinase-like enzyme
MTFDKKSLVKAAPVLWLTGLSGVGKSTLAQAFVACLREQGLNPLFLDGDALREALEGEVDARCHDLQARERRAWRIARLAQLAAVQGIPVVVATISLFHAVQHWSRNSAAPYAEIWLRADIKKLSERNPELYGSVDHGGSIDVVGKDLIAQFPLQAEMVIDQTFERNAVDAQLPQLMAIWQRLSQGAT